MFGVEESGKKEEKDFEEEPKGPVSESERTKKTKDSKRVGQSQLYNYNLIKRILCRK